MQLCGLGNLRMQMEVCERRDKLCCFTEKCWHCQFMNSFRSCCISSFEQVDSKGILKAGVQPGFDNEVIFYFFMVVILLFASICCAKIAGCLLQVFVGRWIIFKTLCSVWYLFWLNLAKCTWWWLCCSGVIYLIILVCFFLFSIIFTFVLVIILKILLHTDYCRMLVTKTLMQKLRTICTLRYCS